ncbi:MAG: hypothetical protein AB1750_18250, partial [Chloroflexota bacterium]
MKALTFTLRLETPLLATQPNAGEPNSAKSYPFIPGSMIRGALVRAYQQQNHAQNISDPNGRGHTLFLTEHVRYLNAYPALSLENESTKRMLPKPLSWFVEKETAKDETATISDYAVKDGNLQKPKSPKGDFCHLASAGSRIGDPRIQVNVHNASEDRNSKKQGKSQVYRYDALAQGQDFIGVILSDDKDEEALITLSEYLGGSLFLG